MCGIIGYDGRFDPEALERGLRAIRRASGMRGRCRFGLPTTSCSSPTRAAAIDSAGAASLAGASSGRHEHAFKPSDVHPGGEPASGQPTESAGASERPVGHIAIDERAISSPVEVLRLREQREGP